MQNTGFEGARLRYARLRRAAYSLAAEQAFTGGMIDRDIRMADIDFWTLSAWKRTWLEPHPSGSGGWDWIELTERFSTDPAALKAALWSGDILCGLVLGRPSNRNARGERSSLSVYFLEANPDPAHPLKRRVAPILLAAAQIYARNLGAATIRLVHPIAGAIPVYLDLGYRVVTTASNTVYCEKEILR